VDCQNASQKDARAGLEEREREARQQYEEGNGQFRDGTGAWAVKWREL
jgi:hypothetical protein